MAINFSLTALTGINSASTGLGVISNNISNAQTMGFKSSRAEFADLFYGSQNSPGTGSRTQVIYQNFNQGAINDTGNVLDMAINGQGFFILSDKLGKRDAVYTRNGSFKLDKDGFITDQSGNALQGYNKDTTLSTSTKNAYKTVLEPMNIGNLNKAPKSTSSVEFDLNLNGQDPVTYDLTAKGGKQSKTGVPLAAATLKNQSYDGPPNYSTSKVVYDSLGGQHRMTVNYYKVSVNPPGTYPTANSSAGNSITYQDETTDWYAQYVMEDYDPVTGTYIKSGSTQDHATNGTNNTNAYTNYQALITGGATTDQAAAAQNSAVIFGLPTTAAGAGESAYNLVLAIGGTTAEANTAKTNAITAFGGGGPAGQLAAYNAAIAATAQAGFTDAQGTQAYTAYSTPASNWQGSESNRLAALFGNPANATQAAANAQAAALALGLTQSQAERAAAAAQAAYTGGSPKQSAFDAAFGNVAGVIGVAPSIPDSVVQAYRFDSKGKLLDFNKDGDFAMVAGNNTPPTTIASPQSWYFDQPNPAGVVGVTEAMTFDANLTKFTQHAGAYTIRSVTQDGYAAGDLVGLAINRDGAIEARYSNGRADTVAKLALANFSNTQGLEKLGSQIWAETSASGPRQLGTPQASGFGQIQSGALEYSNVDVTGELVNMIFMQKMYQASAQVISTDKTLTQTILQI
jgi:flagellar hook-basal body protein